MMVKETSQNIQILVKNSINLGLLIQKDSNSFNMAEESQKSELFKSFLVIIIFGILQAKASFWYSIMDYNRTMNQYAHQINLTHQKINAYYASLKQHSGPQKTVRGYLQPLPQPQAYYPSFSTHIESPNNKSRSITQPSPVSPQSPQKLFLPPVAAGTYQDHLRQAEQQRRLYQSNKLYQSEHYQVLEWIIGQEQEERDRAEVLKRFEREAEQRRKQKSLQRRREYQETLMRATNGKGFEKAKVSVVDAQPTERSIQQQTNSSPEEMPSPKPTRKVASVGIQAQSPYIYNPALIPIKPILKNPHEPSKHRRAHTQSKKRSSQSPLLQIQQMLKRVNTEMQHKRELMMVDSWLSELDGEIQKKNREFRIKKR